MSTDPFTYKSSLEKVRQTFHWAVKIAELITGQKSLAGSVSYDMDRVAMFVDTLFTRFCPHRPGDRVQLREAPTITWENCPGWMSSKHFLVVGAVGTVMEVDMRDGVFGFSVVFD